MVLEFMWNLKFGRKEEKRQKAIQTQNLAEFCRELDALLKAGVSLVPALLIIAENGSFKKRERAIYRTLAENMQYGMKFSDALKKTGGAFPPMMIAMFYMAEEAGELEKAMYQMAEYYAKQHRLHTKLKTAMAYPKFLIAVLAVVLAAVGGYVFPQFEELFVMVGELPLPTRILYAISGFFGRSWYWIAGAIVLGMVLFRSLRNEARVRYVTGYLAIHLPVFGKLWRSIYTARFARALSTLYRSGVPLVNGLEIARNTVGNAYVEAELATAIDRIHTGMGIGDAIDSVRGFRKKLAFIIRVGDETGELDVVLYRIAEDLEYEAEMAMQKMFAYLEPAAILMLALVIGFIMLAVMMPIYASYTAISIWEG